MAAPATRDVTIYQGDAYSHTLTFVDSNGDPVDLTASYGSYAAQVRQVFRNPSQEAGDVLATFDIDDTNAATGVLVLSLSSSDTEDLPEACVYDLEAMSAVATPEPYTLIRGDITVMPEATWS